MWINNKCVQEYENAGLGESSVIIVYLHRLFPSGKQLQLILCVIFNMKAVAVFSIMVVGRYRL